MLSTAYPVRQEILEHLWRTFTEKREILSLDDYEPDPAVVQSWHRCAPRLDPKGQPRPTVLRAQSLAAIRKAHTDLITIAIPYMEDIHQFIEGSACAIVLADGTGCILELMGDESGVLRLSLAGLGIGAYWSEGQLGTNAIGMTLIGAMPVQVVGAEHYLRALHDLVTTAAPIHDVNGRIVGVLGIIGPVTQATSHTTSLVMAAARAISNQLQTNLYLEEANHRLTELNTILEAINEGVIAWNNAGKIHHINTRAGKLLHLNPTAILGQRLTDVLPLPAVLTQAIARQQELHNVEVRFELNQRPIRAFVTLRPIFDGAAHPIGYIAMLRPIEHIHQLVHQQVGSQATLTLDDIVARSPAMSAVVRQAHLAARGTAPVLLRGEGGVGKNHLAQAIHKASERANKPFLSINCQAIPHELMVAEFLGYEQDPVHGDRPSKFELASGGTLFLDQIENLSLEMQAALLHVIETGHIMRLGSTHPIPVNVRIIAATSAPLEQAVQDERFLRHLYYRFGVFNIHVPALRERVEDIPLLVERFLGRLAQNVNTAVLAEEETMKVLCRYPWPGNVRELENVLERALHHSQDGQIRVLDLPEWVRNGRIISHTSPTPLPVLSVAEAEREAIIRAGWACAGRVSEMAQQLGIGRTTLWRKMKRLNISPNQFKKTH